jgi:hypothetical protein
VALIVSDAPCARRGVVHRQPDARRAVRLRRGRLPARDIRAIVANSGNANAIVGPRGAVDERAVARPSPGAGRRRGRRADRVDGRDRRSPCRSTGSRQPSRRWSPRWAATK